MELTGLKLILFVTKMSKYKMNLLQYSITCSCGITITGNSEKGLVELVKLHNQSGRWHLMWKDYFNIIQKTEIEERIEREKNNERDFG